MGTNLQLTIRVLSGGTASFVALVATGMLVLAGCGGGGGSAASSTPAQTIPDTPVATFTLVPARVVRSALCEDEITGLGGCVGINQQAEMPRIIPLDQQTPTNPPVIPFSRKTGSMGDVHTAQTAGTLYEIDNHSFAQTKPNSAITRDLAYGFPTSTVVGRPETLLSLFQIAADCLLKLLKLWSHLLFTGWLILE